MDRRAFSVHVGDKQRKYGWKEDRSIFEPHAKRVRVSMFASQPEEWADPQIIAIVELDLRKIRLRLVLAREAIRERLRELEHPVTIAATGH
jgi:hypothetical protein